ncbi:MAG: PD-(D/E)XK nuclease family protein [Terriglobales bacterium]
MAGVEGGVWETVEQGALLLTSHARLARGLREAYDLRQLAAGRQAWPSPAIETLQAWCERVWAGVGERVCLSPAQEAVLWEGAITAIAGEPQWLDVPATAAAAARGWELARHWMLPLQGAEWKDGRDCEAFLQWAQAFAASCEQGGWIASAELPLRLAERLDRGLWTPPPVIWLAGFDQLSPAEQQLCQALEGAGSQVRAWQSGGAPAIPRMVVCSDPEQELRDAAEWARGEVERGVGTGAEPVGVVLPDLAAQRGAVERVLDEVFHPLRPPWSEAPRAFHLSLGEPLAEVPLVRAGLRCANLLAQPEPVELAAVLEWVQLPYLDGAESERGPRADLARKLRAGRRARWRWEQVIRQAAGACPVLAACLQRALQRRRGWPARQSHAAWAAALRELWTAAGWPAAGGRGLDSAEYQARVAFERLLDSFAELDAVAGPVTPAAALDRLEGMAGGRIFQPEAAPAPVQVMGWLEAAGQRFAALRLCGLHSEAVPGGSRPHPFLPMRLQIAHGLPQATAAGAAAWAQRQWLRLCAAGAEVIASYPAADAAGRPLPPSPLLAGLAAEPSRLQPPAAGAAATVIEEDAAAPPCTPDERQGGSLLLRDQSQCPFRAFARHRLQARGPEPAEPGLDAATRGKLVHALLRDIWRWLESSERLAALPAEELEAGVAERAARVIGEEARFELDGQPALAALERQRLTALALEWLHSEGQRQPFRIRALEHKQERSFAGLELHLRLDRVDETAGGEVVIVDYKTGSAGPREWMGGRPHDPQLPLYLVTQPRREEVAAVAFALVRAGDMGWAGRERSPQVLRSTGRAATFKNGWEAQVREWQEVLERLAEDYRAGAAAVDPLPKVCDTCDLHMLCRIHERTASRQDPGAEDETGEDDDG